jgi:hypothetical protein
VANCEAEAGPVGLLGAALAAAVDHISGQLSDIGGAPPLKRASEAGLW